MFKFKVQNIKRRSAEFDVVVDMSLQLEFNISSITTVHKRNAACNDSQSTLNK